MTAYLVAFCIAGLTSVVVTPGVRLYALRIGAVASPGGRHVHGRKIPRLGGLAIFVAFFAPLLALFFVKSEVASVFRDNLLKAAGLLLGGTVMCVVGWLDDTRRLAARHKLTAQVVAATLAYACGFQLAAVKLPIVGEVTMGVFALPVTVIWIVGIINAINLIDGLDGLAAGVVFFAGLTNFMVAHLTGAVFPAFIMAATLGAVLGFLFYNFNPARIFMGDSGSYFLGFVLATTALVGAVQKTSTAIALLVPVVALGIPIFDTLFSIVRRILERRPIFSPDRGHLHHRLLDMGITHRRAVLLLYGVSVVFTVAAIGISLDRAWPAGVAILVACVVMVGLVRFVGYFEYLHRITRQKARLRGRDAEFLRFLLPDFVMALQAAPDETALWRAVEHVRATAQLACVELVATDRHPEETLHAWASADGPLPLSPDLVSARFPLGREDQARCALRFRWASDFGDVSPQTEVLLQVLVDVLATHLTRVESVHAPHTTEAVSLAPESATTGAYVVTASLR